MSVSTFAAAVLLPMTIGVAWATPTAVSAAEARAAVERYVPLLEKTLQVFTCSGACHHRLGLMVYGMARERNVAVHESLFSKVIEGMQQQRTGLLEATLQGIGEPEPG